MRLVPTGGGPLRRLPHRGGAFAGQPSVSWRDLVSTHIDHRRFGVMPLGGLARGASRKEGAQRVSAR